MASSIVIFESEDENVSLEVGFDGIRCGLAKLRWPRCSAPRSKM